MKRSFKAQLLSIILITSLLIAGCTEPKPHEHTWADASCSTPKHCTVCGKTEGEPLSHEWTEASVQAPKTCKLCGETVGKPLDKIIPDDHNLALELEKIPIANKSMSEDELRDIVVQFMKLQLTFAYTPSFEGMTSYKYYIKNLKGRYGFEGCQIPFEEGKYYGGIPYVGNASGSVYRWLPFYDADTGVMDWTPIINSRRINWTHSGTVYPDVSSAIFGNSCSSSCFWAWARISNQLKSCWTSGWVPKNGYVKVGEYTLANGDTNHGGSTKNVCNTNGVDVMYKAYASMKRADGLVQSGHAVMIVADPVVVYNDDGSINGEKSYVCVAEQKASFLTAAPSSGGVELYSPLNANGTTYRIMGNYWGTVVNGVVKDMEWSFEELYDKGFLPFTVPELIGLDPIEEAEVGFSHEGSTITMYELSAASVTSNYFISDIHFTVKDKSGNETYIGMYASSTEDYLDYTPTVLSNALIKNKIYSSKTYIKTELDKYMNGDYTIIITCRVSTGELLTVYTGTLISQ